MSSGPAWAGNIPDAAQRHASAFEAYCVRGMQCRREASRTSYRPRADHLVACARVADRDAAQAWAALCRLCDPRMPPGPWGDAWPRMNAKLDKL